MFLGDAPVRLDFTASDDQARGAINAGFSQALTGALYAVRCYVDPTIPMNEGCYAPIEVAFRKGSLLDPNWPAACGGRVVSVTAVASKKGVTVVDITSTRMLMAHGFLARIFQTFEAHRTSVDVVTTSEVSVSVTVDDARRLPEIAAALREVAEVTREDDMAIICAVGDGLQRDPTFVSHLLDAIGGVPIRMLSQAAARRNVTLVIREADLETALVRVHERFFGVPA